jgi:hypothetical protein
MNQNRLKIPTNHILFMEETYMHIQAHAAAGVISFEEVGPHCQIK